MIKSVDISEIDKVFELLQQDGVRGYNGQFANSENEWFVHFFDAPGCFVEGWYEEGKLIAVIIAEQLTGDGCMLWYLAVKPEKQGQGYGTRFLHAFEYLLKEGYGCKWIYLLATGNSSKFYGSNGYVTSKYSHGWEHVKSLM